jgi:hypothetical protein
VFYFMIFLLTDDEWILFSISFASDNILRTLRCGRFAFREVPGLSKYVFEAIIMRCLSLNSQKIS